MELGILDTKNPCYDADRWCEVEALAKGGKHFKDLLSKFLPQNPVEPADVYSQRRAQAHYTSYVGSIINLYTSWLFASGFAVNAYERDSDEPSKTISEFYGRFQENVGNETQLRTFMKERTRAALTNHQAMWLVELPSNGGEEPKDALDYEKRGLGNATLKAVERHELFDWEEDETGALNWALVHTCYDTRASWALARNTTVETWRVYDKRFVYTYQLTYEKGRRPTDQKFMVPQIGEAAPHGFQRVPLVRMHVPKELTIGEQTFDAQLEHFRQDNALSWLTRRTCYAQPVFNIEDGENPPRMGAGYAVLLGPDDKMGWTAPPVAPFDILQKNVDSKRDQIYRIVHQMAQGLDNNAETVGRSADSKEIDAAATRIMLNAYGEIVAKAIEETYEMISEARGESNYEWSVEGFSGYDTATVSSLIANAKEARALGIPSQTFHKELCTKVALALHPEADQRVKDTIRSEVAQAKFEVSSVPDSLEGELLKAKAALDHAKADAEPIKAKAAMTSAKQPKPAPAAPGKPTPKK
jgi:hypothetical protein